MRSSEIRLRKLKLRMRDKRFANHKAPCTAIWQQPLQSGLAFRSCSATDSFIIKINLSQIMALSIEREKVCAVCSYLLLVIIFLLFRHKISEFRINSFKIHSVFRENFDCVSSFQTFPRTSKNHLPPLYCNIVYWERSVVVYLLNFYVTLNSSCTSADSFLII